ncbi:toll/interleukin-1 receptor domain-containing protein [Ciceribacter sp. RN22]|uniref:toll/interleukin-1 receptor domain-containing protein n=1 Tax=Ciceribacter sp. RN22 TaxID=2954932 RepID=UPI00209361C9|nr:toll/interleukin-1 receptor domain-containing protein [Ciceribacter sp. RN22]MCO6178842.1 toll/interleukin-1 receptor domain-containing protein [Ciceribacter sp. RN22]
MARRTQAIGEIEDRDGLEAYLATRSIAEAQLVALRSALRVLPTIVSSPSIRPDRQRRLTLAGFRALFISWAARNYPAHEMAAAASAAASDAAKAVADALPAGRAAVAEGKAAFATAARAFATAARAFAVADSAAFYAADSATFTAYAADATARAAAAFPGSRAAAAARAAIWAVVRADLEQAAQSGAGSLLQTSLWAGVPRPVWVVNAENGFDESLNRLGADWGVVRDWYAAVARGHVPFMHLAGRREDVIVSLATEKNKFWERDPDEVMQDVAARLGGRGGEESAASREPHPTSGTDKETTKRSKVDFFISYSTRNETEAREINAYLEDAGYTTIAQFKDFPVGSNFVIEMQEGLERGARAVVLLSPDYVVSEHCRAEWAAIYNADPIGRKRKLVSFLLRPAELNRLARQIVYKSLVGLPREERRRAVLDAIHHNGAVEPEALRQRLAEIASPDVVSTPDQKLDAVPNATFDRAAYDVDLPDLPTVLRSTVSALLKALPANAPPVIGAVLEGYRAHLDERGTKPIVGLLVDYAEIAQLEFNSTDFELWGAGLSHLFMRYFSHHARFLGHYPLSQERERTFAEAEVNEDLASGSDFVTPVVQVADVIDRLAEIDGVTPRYESVVKAQARMATDIDGLPPNIGENAGKGNDVTPKRRFVLMQIGFWERSLAALAGISTLIATPQAQAAVVALRRAIEAFLKFLV